MTVRTIPSDQCSMADAFSAFTGRPRKTAEQKSEDQERSIAWREREDAMAKAPMGPDHYWRRKAWTDACNARFSARCAEIHARYHPVELTEVENLAPGRIAA